MVAAAFISVAIYRKGGEPTQRRIRFESYRCLAQQPLILDELVSRLVVELSDGTVNSPDTVKIKPVLSEMIEDGLLCFFGTSFNWATLYNWAELGAHTLLRLYNIIATDIRKSDRINVDESPVDSIPASTIS